MISNDIFGFNNLLVKTPKLEEKSKPLPNQTGFNSTPGKELINDQITQPSTGIIKVDGSALTKNPSQEYTP